MSGGAGQQRLDLRTPLPLSAPLLAVRHPPRSGWLDELGRLKGGRTMGLGVAHCAP